MRSEIQTLAQWANGTDWRLSLQHSCAHHALIWITRGQGLAVIEGVRRGIGVHNALAIPAGSMFSLDLSKGAFGLVCLIPVGASVAMPLEPEHLRIRDVEGQNELTSLLDAMQREQSKARVFMNEVLNAQAQIISVWLRRAMIANGPQQKPAAAIRLATAYAALVERDFMNGRSMAVYARALGVTPTHLTRVLKQTSGMTAADLLTERSLHAAREMLETGETPVGQIAARLGFGSAAYFSRFILHHTGQSPSALRTAAALRRPAVANVQ